MKKLSISILRLPYQLVRTIELETNNSYLRRLRLYDPQTKWIITMRGVRKIKDAFWMLIDQVTRDDLHWKRIRPVMGSELNNETLSSMEILEKVVMAGVPIKYTGEIFVQILTRINRNGNLSVDDYLKIYMRDVDDDKYH